MTSLPDWLIERAALDEVPATSRDRIDRADPAELADRIAAVRADSARELAGHPTGPAIAQITAAAGDARRRAARQRNLRRSVLGVATSAVAIVAVIGLIGLHHAPAEHRAVTRHDDDDGTRVKGKARLVAFRQVGDQVERLEQDALVHAGDIIQLRYNAGGKHYGVIASVDGAGVVTLHYPVSEDAPLEATAISPEPTALPEAYALDDAPRFERFFFITANEPIDLHQSLDAVRALAHRDDSADAALELPAGLHQWSLRLRKPNESP